MFGLLILGIIVVCIGSNTFSGVAQSLRSDRWPRAAAHVTASVLHRDATDVAPRWSPAVEFRYSVGNTVYTSRRIRFLMAPLYQRERAAEIVDAYSVGRAVTIAYNPANPGDSVLEPGLPPGALKQVLIAMFLIGLTGYIFYEIHHPARRVLLRTFSDDSLENQQSESDRSEAA